MAEIRDSIYYSQLARKARQLAAAHSDPVVKRRLRETANQHDREARKLARVEAQNKVRKMRRLSELFD